MVLIDSKGVKVIIQLPDSTETAQEWQLWIIFSVIKIISTFNIADVLHLKGS